MVAAWTVHGHKLHILRPRSNILSSKCSVSRRGQTNVCSGMHSALQFSPRMMAGTIRSAEYGSTRHMLHICDIARRRAGALQRWRMPLI